MGVQGANDSNYPEGRKVILLVIPFHKNNSLYKFCINFGQKMGFTSCFYHGEKSYFRWKNQSWKNEIYTFHGEITLSKIEICTILESTIFMLNPPFNPPFKQIEIE